MSLAARWTAFWLIVTSCLGFVAYVAFSGVRPVPADAAGFVMPAPVPTRTPTVGLFIGDSYTAGGAGVTRSAAFAARACRSLDWVCYFDARPATGYLTGDSENPAYPDRLAADKIYRPDVVVVSGGRADLDATLGTDRLERAAQRYFTALRTQFAKADVVVLEPFSTATYPGPQTTLMRTQLEAAATAAGVRYVSTSGWLTEAQLSSDGTLPLPAGHRALARRTAAALKGYERPAEAASPKAAATSDAAAA